MKILPCCALLSALILTSISTSFAVVDTYIYENETLNISLSMPAEFHDDLSIMERGNTIQFIHDSATESIEKPLFTLEKHDRNNYFADMESRANLDQYNVVAMSENDVWTCQRHQLIAPVCHVCLDIQDYFSKFLTQCIILTDPVPMPEIQGITSLPAFTMEQGMTKISRGQSAQLIYDMLNLQGYTPSNPTIFKDMTVADRITPVLSCLESYDIINGYPDYTFHSNNPVSRAEFVVMVHRAMFEPQGTVSNVTIPVSDADVLSGEHWATPYLCNAWEKQWIYVQTDGVLHPDQAITYAEAVRILMSAIETL